MQKSSFPKMSAVLNVLILSAGLSAGAQCYERLPIQSAEPIVSGTASGDEVQLISGEFIPVVKVGGLGNFIESWQLKMVVKIKEIAYEKVFRIVQPPSFGVRPANPLVYQFSFESGDIRYLGRTEFGYGLYELSVSEKHTVSPATPLTLEVIMPARYNMTPNIGNPTVGWYGPIVGLKNIRVKM